MSALLLVSVAERNYDADGTGRLVFFTIPAPRAINPEESRAASCLFTVGAGRAKANIIKFVESITES